MSTPISGMLLGILVGLGVGVLMVFYFDITDSLGRFCLVAAALMVFQLLGATIGAALGKPHDAD